jgi:hypothetical protein
VSVKNRWVDPREQVLNVPITCWCYGPSKPSSWLSIEASLFPTASLVIVGEKLSTDPQIKQSSSCELCREPFFSGGSESVQICWRLHEILLCVDRVRYVWSGTIRGLSVGCVWHVGWVFPCRVYIDSNRCDSQIWLSLVCGSHHVANLMNLMRLIVTDVVLLNTHNCLQLLYD